MLFDELSHNAEMRSTEGRVTYFARAGWNIRGRYAPWIFVKAGFYATKLIATQRSAFIVVMAYASDGEPMARVPEVARTAFSVGTRIVAPVQTSLPDRSVLFNRGSAEP